MYTFIQLSPHLTTVCVQIFMGRIFHERPAPNNFCNFNFANGGLQQQTCTVCMHVSHFYFRDCPLIRKIRENKVLQKFVRIRYHHCLLYIDNSQMILKEVCMLLFTDTHARMWVTGP